MVTSKNNYDLSFDIRGNLQPGGENVVSFESMQPLLVEPYSIATTRKKLYEGLVRYNDALTQVLDCQPYEQWIDGSFVTNKVNPRDIDTVSFLDFRLVEAAEQELQRFTASIAREKYGVDGYIVKRYPEEHPHYARTNSDMAYWRYWFSTTRPDHRKKRYDKGFIKLNFNYE